MDFEDQIARHAQDLLASAGREMTVHHWERAEGAVTPGGDPDWGNPTTTTMTTGELVARGTPNWERTAAGLDESVDAMIWLPADVTVSDGAAVTERQSQIVDETTGKRYEVRLTDPEGNGKIRCVCVLE